MDCLTELPDARLQSPVPSPQSPVPSLISRQDSRGSYRSRSNVSKRTSVWEKEEEAPQAFSLRRFHSLGGTKFSKFLLVRFPSISLALVLYSLCFIPESSSKMLQSNIYTTPTDSQQQVIIGNIFRDFFHGGQDLISGGLKFCNYSSEPYVNVAYGYWRSQRSGWASTGWFRVNQGTCTHVTNLPLKNTRYYYYADGSNGKVWNGNYTFCAPSQAFTDYHKSHCSKNDQRGFREIYVGRAYKYTVNLT